MAVLGVGPTEMPTGDRATIGEGLVGVGSGSARHSRSSVSRPQPLGREEGGSGARVYAMVIAMERRSQR